MSDLPSLVAPLVEVLLTGAALAGGPAGVPLAGLALHHGGVSPIWAVSAPYLGLVLRARALERRHHIPHAERAGWLRLLLFALLESLVLVAGGFYLAHLVAALPSAFGIVVALPSTLGLILWLASAASTLRPSFLAWPNLSRVRILTSAGALAVLALGAWWHPRAVGPETAAAELLAERGVTVVPGTFRWVEPPRVGLRGTLTRPRGVLLARPADEPAEVFLVRAITNHEGLVTDVSDAYNLSRTSAVSEAGLSVSSKFAVWRLAHRGYTLSVEIADLRGGPSARGPGWSRLSRLQRAITDWQETGQLRGVGRMSVKLKEPAKNASFSIPGGRLVVKSDEQQIELDLGRQAISGGKDLAELIVHEPGPPGNLTTWAVDRLRASPLIGSDRMQWVKGVAQRAAEQIEDLEEELVGIDADEAVSEELGGLLEQLPVASVGSIPGWPPAPLELMHSPALPGEGQWVSLGGDSLVAPPGEVTSPFLFTFIRTDRKRRYAQVSLTLWDARRIALHMEAGTREPKSTTGEIGEGQIPRKPEVLSRVAAAFNGAFQAVHGSFGMVVNRRVLLPPKPYGATVAEMADGSTAFGTWPESTPPPERVVSLRQNMTPLVVDDRANPYERHWWGGVPEGWSAETRTVRSGVCMTKEHFGAYFYSASVDPTSLAEAMKRARCVYGIHLDMNAGHTGFEFYRLAEKGELPAMDRPLDPMWEARGVVSGAPGWEFSTRLMVRKMPLMDFPRYVHRTSRDFFYLTRRYLLPSPRLEPLMPAYPGDGAWRVELPENTWPHAAAVTLMHVPTEEEKPVAVALSVVDPKQVVVAAAGEEALVTLEHARGDEGAAIWLLDRRFSVDARAPSAAAHLVLRGATEPSKDMDTAACVDRAGYLYLAEATVGKRAHEAVARVLGMVGCETPIYLPETARVVIAGLPSARRKGKTDDEPLRLQRSPFSGMTRLFPETPIVPPSKWALPQRRPVVYGGEAEADVGGPPDD